MKLWGGRFAQETDALARRFNDSLSFDIRLYGEDIQGSIAWAEGLVTAAILTPDEATTIIDGLNRVKGELDADQFQFQPGDEDIHTAVERRLIELAGPVGGKLHTGRSRNDQVATDFRLWTIKAIDQLQADLRQLQLALIEQAEGHAETLLPGYTHLQHAQPISWAHWLLAHFWPLTRDARRLAQARRQADVLPLGSAALAGTTLAVDRRALAATLGFTAVTPNSLDAVSDRDFAADFLYAAAMLGLHLSRLAEQLILFSSAEFGFVRLADQYSTGSSLMPQKKNPDTLELTRGKSGRLIGNLTGLLATLKGLPSTYDKDLQEDKEPVFDAFDNLALILPVMAGLIQTLTLRPERMAAQLEAGLLATDLADYLVHKGMPFREAHGAVGAVVRLAEDSGREINALSLAELREISAYFGDDVTAVFDPQLALQRRNIEGGTGPTAVAQQLAAARKMLSADYADFAD